MKDEAHGADEHTTSLAGRPYTVRAVPPPFFDEAERGEALKRVERGLYAIFEKYINA